MSDTNSAYPTVATIIGCPEELSAANGLVATPISITGEFQPPSIPKQPIAPDTSDIKDPVKKAVIDNIWGKLPTRNPIERLRCDICNVECVGKGVFETHLIGAKHTKRLKEQEMQKEFAGIPFMRFSRESNIYTCTLCNATLNAFSQISAHIGGTKHRNKIQSKEKLGTSITQINDDPEKQRVDATPNLLYCATCNVHVNSTQQLEQHTASRKHIHRVNGHLSLPRLTPYYKRMGLGAVRGRGIRGRTESSAISSASYWHNHNNFNTITEQFVPAAQYQNHPRY